MVDGIAVTGVVLFFSFLVTLAIMPFLIRRMNERGIVGKDMNKFKETKVAELGGIGVIFGFSFGIITAISAFSYLNLIEINLPVLMAGFLTIVLVGFIGVVDDLVGWKKGIGQKMHALVPVFAALPLMAVQVGVTSMLIPFLGVVSFGIIYSLIIVPLGITGASNAFNMLAGFNGLEAGLGIITSATMMVIGFFYGSIEAVILSAAVLGALIAFMKFNWYPAKVFPGDSLTLMIGTTIATAAIIGNMEKIGILLLSIFFIELVFKAKQRFRSECFGIPQKDGTLKPNPKGGSLTHWIMRRGNFTEPQVVSIILGLQVAVSATVFILFWFELW